MLSLRDLQDDPEHEELQGLREEALLQCVSLGDTTLLGAPDFPPQFFSPLIAQGDIGAFAHPA